MTISSATRKAGPFLGNGVTTSFPFSFKVFQASDLQVLKTTVAGVDVGLTLNSDYSVTLNADQNASPGGTIAYPLSGTLLQSGEKLTATGVLTALQETHLTNGGNFFANTIEDEMDYLTILVQQCLEQLSRSLLASSSDLTPALSLGTALQRALKYVTFDASGNISLAATLPSGTLSQASIISFLGADPLARQTPAEAAVSVTPTNVQYGTAPYNVLRYNAKGDGTTVDDAAFNTAHLVAGSNPVYVPSVGYKWNLSTFIDGNFISDGTLSFTGHGYVKYKTLQGNSVNDNNIALSGMQWNGAQIVILGDSITVGTAATQLTSGYAYGVGRSLMNAADHGFDKDPGFGWHSTINVGSSVSMGEYTHNGTVVATGLVASRLSLAAGQFVQISGKTMASVDVIYDGAVSSGSLVFALNGTTYATKAVSGAGLNSTFQTVIRASNGVAGFTNENDVITITASGGTVVITDVVPLKTSSNGPLVFVAAESGTTYGDFTGAAAITELAYYLNFLRPSSEKLLVLALGTNSIYNSGKATTPAAMIAALNSIITQINVACTNMNFAIHVPPRSNEGLFPVITAGYTHADYVNALEDYARTHNYTLIRHDRSALSYGNGYADGLHPTTAFHRIMARNVCDIFGIPYNTYVKSAINDFEFNNQIDIPYNSTWGSFTNSANRLVATRVGNLVYLSGLAQPNASVSTTIGILPVGYRPTDHKNFTVARSDAGVTTVEIDTSGNIICAAVPTTWFSLDGVVITLKRP